MNLASPLLKLIKIFPELLLLTYTTLQAEIIKHRKLGMYEMSLQRKRILMVDNSNDQKHDEKKYSARKANNKIPSYPMYLIKLAK